MIKYFVSRRPEEGYIGIRSLEEIRAALALGHLDPTMFCAESDGRAFKEFVKSGAGHWRTIKDLLEEDEEAPPLQERREHAIPATANEVHRPSEYDLLVQIEKNTRDTKWALWWIFEIAPLLCGLFYGLFVSGQ